MSENTTNGLGTSEDLKQEPVITSVGGDFDAATSEGIIYEAPKEATIEQLYVQIAQVCHEANKAYCESIGDTSQPSWADAPEWQKQSAINGVKFHHETPGAAPWDSHESWMAEKVAQGWVYGEVKDPEAKTHPCLVPYIKLPIEQRMKDYIFGGIAKAMLKLYSE